jgi:hypothetical protein
MSRRPVLPRGVSSGRRASRMAPGGRLKSESEIKPHHHPVGMVGVAPSARWWDGGWSSATLTTPLGPAAGDLVFVVYEATEGPSDIWDDPSLLRQGWATRYPVIWDVFTHDGRPSYVMTTGPAGGAFVFFCRGTLPLGKSAVDESEGDNSLIFSYGKSGSTFTLSDTEQGHMFMGWAAVNYGVPDTYTVGVEIVEPAVSPIPSPMASVLAPAGTEYWYSVGSLAVTTARS